MDDYLTSLEMKLDKILENQEKIIEKLDESIILPISKHSDNRKKDKGERTTLIMKMLKEDFALNPHKFRLQKQFNLLVPPHSNRVKEFLKTNDPSVFDGLRRSI